MGRNRLLAVTAAGAMAVSGSLAAAGSPVVAAASITVTTTADVVANDGLVSLREAFELANGDADDTVIELGVGLNYQLTICVAKEPVDFGNGFFGAPADDDLNADGDLDHTATDDITINGNGSTIENTCLYDRVIHNVELDARLFLDDVTITGGVGAPDSGSNVWSPGGATLTDVTISGGVEDVGSQSAALVVGDSSNPTFDNRLTMHNSSILFNEPGGVRVEYGDAVVTDSFIADSAGNGFAISFGTLQMSGSTLVDNGGHGVAGVDGSIYVTDSVAANNVGYGFRNTGNADSGQPLELTDVTSIDNGSGGARCSYCTALITTDSLITGNDGTGLSMRTNVTGPTMTITRTEVSDNGGAAIGTAMVAAEGGGIEMAAEDGVTPTIAIERSTIAGNTAAPGVEGGGVRLLGAGLDVSNSTITLNTSSDRGGGVASAGTLPITFDHVTLVENESTIGGANLDRGGANLTSTGSVIGMPVGSVNCVAGGLITSGGYNQADDNTCDFGGGTGDLAPAPAPALLPLADNGGATPTRIPDSGSPLLGAIPATACSVDDDQRDVTRPQGPDCEVGAVEVDERPAAVIVAGRTNLTRPDREYRDWLEARGFVVDTLADDDVNPASVAGLADADLVLVSSSVVPSKIGTQLAGLGVPVLVTEGHLLDDFGMAQPNGETATATELVIVDDAASGYSGYLSVLTSPHRLAFGVPSGAAHVIARASVNGKKPVIFTYDSGDVMWDGSPAPAARGSFLFDYQGPRHARSATFDLLDHTLDRLLS